MVSRFFRRLCVAVLLWPILLFAQERANLSEYVLERYGDPPAIPVGPLSEPLQEAVQSAFAGAVAPIGSVSRSAWGESNSKALQALVEGQDPRVVWLISDLLRFTWQRELYDELATAGACLLGITFDAETENRRDEITNHLIAWNIPAPGGYLTIKRAIFTNAVHGWNDLFVEGDIDWRMVSWGGVPIDARPYDQTDIPCSCIPAVDNPKVVSAEAATWLQDRDIVFGLEVNGEYRAYPRRIMEVREMVNDTLGGRQLGIPYCTLCGAAQAFFTDNMPPGVERPILRTSGLLVRSNKVMYDIHTNSIFDTFKGIALTGRLAEIDLRLQQTTMVTTEWASWKSAYPQTTVLDESLALGKDFDLRNTRDANGPIFPIGNVDPRLSVHEDIVGVIPATGVPVAFPKGAAYLALQNLQPVVFENVKLVLDAGGIKAVDRDGTPLPSHEAFWFAWSQFYPQTQLWGK